MLNNNNSNIITRNNNNNNTKQVVSNIKYMNNAHIVVNERFSSMYMQCEDVNKVE